VNCSALTEIVVDPNNPNYSSSGGILFNKDQTALLLYPNGKSGDFTVPSSVTHIGAAAFAYNSKLTRLILPANVTSISFASFSECSGLTQLTLSPSITNIPGYAFYNCTALTSIVIPSSVTHIEDWAFYGCSSLGHIYFYGDAPSTGYFNVFATGANTIINYLPGATGWGETLAGVTCTQLDQGLYDMIRGDGVQAGRAQVIAAPNDSALYTLDQVQALHVDAPLLAKDPTTGKFKLTIAVKKSTDLSTFVSLPITSDAAALNAQGEMEFQFSSSDRAAFFRLESH
jgi:hypothetical protein